MLERKTIRVNANWARGGVEVFIFEHGPGDRRLVGSVTYTEGSRFEYADAALVLEEPECVRLMDDLWNAGFRPSQAKDVSDLVAAVRHHRDDAVKVRDQALSVVLKERAT